jgi:hypothetical protein
MITLYTQPYKNSSGKLCQQQISIATVMPFAEYKAYTYVAETCSERKDYWSKLRYQATSPNTESLLRARRLINFVDTTGLKPKTFNNSQHGEFYDKIKSVCHLDHTTIFTSKSEAIFLLNEPYYIANGTQSAMHAAGFAVIKVPENLSPYCGRWDITPGANPGTSTYLITHAKNAVKLAGIQQRLYVANQSAPAWNSVEGIEHVK